MGTTVKGIYTQGTSTPISFTASIQPATGDEQESFPEGLREKSIFRLYTDFELYSENQVTKQPGDLINYNGKVLKVIRVLPWQNNVINHYKAFMSELTPDQE
ncbi:MAG: hypothetical protein HC773_05225 [Scytonema sp. CRU_2_7]|nr:hypothetical protein [Scytonema sp. CRU_2_7]